MKSTTRRAAPRKNAPVEDDAEPAEPAPVVRGPSRAPVVIDPAAVAVVQRVLDGITLTDPVTIEDMHGVRARIHAASPGTLVDVYRHPIGAPVTVVVYGVCRREMRPV